MSNIIVQNENSLEVVDEEIIPIYEVTDTGDKVVNARELHDYLNVTSRFRDWIKSRIKQYGFEEELDFWKFLGESNGGRPRKEYLFPLEYAKFISRREDSSKAPSLIEYFEGLDGNDIELYVKRQERDEIIFKNNLENVFSGITELKCQFPVLKYKLDFYLPEYNLVIEFDEPYHSNQLELDLIRQQEIEEELGCKFVRIKSDEKLSAGLNKALREVM